MLFPQFVHSRWDLISNILFFCSCCSHIWCMMYTIICIYCSAVPSGSVATYVTCAFFIWRLSSFAPFTSHPTTHLVAYKYFFHYKLWHNTCPKQNSSHHIYICWSFFQHLLKRSSITHLHNIHPNSLLSLLSSQFAVANCWNLFTLKLSAWENLFSIVFFHRHSSHSPFSSKNTRSSCCFPNSDRLQVWLQQQLFMCSYVVFCLL